MFASVWHVRFELFTLLDYEKSLGTDGTKTTDREKKRKKRKLYLPNCSVGSKDDC